MARFCLCSRLVGRLLRVRQFGALFGQAPGNTKTATDRSARRRWASLGAERVQVTGPNCLATRRCGSMGPRAYLGSRDEPPGHPEREAFSKPPEKGAEGSDAGESPLFLPPLWPEWTSWSRAQLSKFGRTGSEAQTAIREAKSQPGQQIINRIRTKLADARAGSRKNPKPASVQPTSEPTRRFLIETPEQTPKQCHPPEQAPATIPPSSPPSVV